MTEIKTSRGKTFEVGFIGVPMRNVGRLMFEVKDGRTLSLIAADFDGLESISKTDDLRPGETVLYEGFSELTGLSRQTDGSVRITLEKP